jgi:RNA 2',3'-cyclic 3'-phosphodiesterase
MSEKRLFVGIPLPDELAKTLATCRNAVHHRELAWVNIENLHITLLFMGDIASGEIDNIAGKLAWLVTFPGFCLRFTEVQVIKKRGKTSMIWAAFEESKEFVALATQIAQIVGIPSDYPPLPHITLARVKRNKIVSVDKNALPAINHLRLAVKKINLYESNLTPQGSVYTVLREWVLKDSGHDC